VSRCSHKREQPLKFYEPDVLPAAQPIVSKHYRKTQWFYRHGTNQHLMSNQQFQSTVTVKDIYSDQMWSGNLFILQNTLINFKISSKRTGKLVEETNCMTQKRFCIWLQSITYMQIKVLFTCVTNPSTSGPSTSHRGATSFTVFDCCMATTNIYLLTNINIPVISELKITTQADSPATMTNKLMCACMRACVLPSLRHQLGGEFCIK